MKRGIIIYLLIFKSTLIFSQAVWTKEDRNTLYQEYLTMLNTKYKDISVEQKESIALCAMSTTTEKYTKTDFESKIDIEIKRIYEAQIGVCAKNIGVELNNTSQINVQSVVTNATKEEVQEWSRVDKEQLSKEISDYITKFPHLSEEQKEKIEICYINDITSKYTKKQYSEFISIEVRQIKENLTIRCANNLGIDLNPKPQEIQKSELNIKDLIVGTWKTDNNYTITFNENGTFLKSFNERFIMDKYYAFIQGESTNGDWFLDSKGVITMNEKWIAEEPQKLIGKAKSFSLSANGKFKVDEIKSDYFKITIIEGQQCCGKYGETPKLIIQANKVK